MTMLWVIVILACVGVGCAVFAAVVALLDSIERRAGRNWAICAALCLAALAASIAGNLF